MAEAEDPKVDRLRKLLGDGRPTLVFAAYRATVQLLRMRLEPRSRIAWCTGDEAGIGPTRLPRETVLAWFRPDTRDPTGHGPAVLVTTDVAAEGLDLQRAGRVIHYDLPWTAVRLEQRAGRAARLGSPHRSVDLIRFEPPGPLERRLGLGRAIARTSRLGRGADPETGTMIWEAYPALAARMAAIPGRRGLARGVAGTVQGLAGFEILRGNRVAGRLVAARVDGRWTDDAGPIAAAIAASLAAPSGAVVMSAAARETFRSAAAWAWHAAGGGPTRAASPEQIAARRRVRAWARSAIRARDVAAIRMAERAHAQLRRGLTAGERRLAAEIAAAPDHELPTLMAALPDLGFPEPFRLRLIGCIHFDLPGSMPGSDTAC
jgi:hypothetical protein